MKLLFITDFGRDPYWNMAVDEWLLTKAARSNDAVYLRLYTWESPCITIGFHQDYSLVVQTDLLSDTPVVRRVTGGRALFHEMSEITYAFAAPVGIHGTKGEPFGSTLASSGKMIAEILRWSLKAIGLEVSLVRGSSDPGFRSLRGQRRPCMESSTRFELVNGRRKVVASAQRRLKTAFLQHGSIKLVPAAQHPALPSGFDAQFNVHQRVTRETLDIFSESMKENSGRILGLAPAETELTEFEQREVCQLREKVSEKPLEKRNIL